MPLALYHLLHRGVVVVLGNEIEPRPGALELFIECRRHLFHGPLVAAAIAHQDDVRESHALEARRHVGEHGTIGRRGEHHAAGRHAIAVGTAGLKREDRRDERVPELARDCFAHHLEHEVVFARRQVRAVGFDAAGEDETGGLAALDGVAHFHPRELFSPDAVERRNRPRCVHFRFAPLGGFGLLLRRQWRTLRARVWRLCGRVTVNRADTIANRINSFIGTSFSPTYYSMLSRDAALEVLHVAREGGEASGALFQVEPAGGAPIPREACRRDRRGRPWPPAAMQTVPPTRASLPAPRQT